jgi:hypothetical protein
MCHMIVHVHRFRVGWALLIDWAKAAGEIDPAKFATVDWRLVANGTPLAITVQVKSG